MTQLVVTISNPGDLALGRLQLFQNFWPFAVLFVAFFYRFPQFFIQGNCKGKLPLGDRLVHGPQVLFDSGVGFGTHGDETELWQGFDYNGVPDSYIYSRRSAARWQLESHCQKHVLSVCIYVRSFVPRASSFDVLLYNLSPYY